MEQTNLLRKVELECLQKTPRYRALMSFLSRHLTTLIFKAHRTCIFDRNSNFVMALSFCQIGAFRMSNFALLILSWNDSKIVSNHLLGSKTSKRFHNVQQFETEIGKIAEISNFWFWNKLRNDRNSMPTFQCSKFLI